MSLTAGAISLVSKTSSQVVLSATAATGGTGPYTYQWYRSIVSGFTPGGGNILAGKTTLSLTDTTVLQGTQYYYKLVATDTGNSNVTVEYAQLGVQSSVASPNQNQFLQSTVVGVLDLRLNFNTIAVQIDASVTATLYPGQAVKIVDSAGGAPKVQPCTADADEVLGFLNYNQKNIAFVAGDAAEISIAGNVMFLLATSAIARGAKVALDFASVGGVKAISGSGGEDIVGWAVDKAAAAGDVIRVYILTPSFAKDGV